MPAPTYQRIADDLRREILDGTRPPGSKLPSRHELAAQYEVSDRVAVEAVRLLVAEGFVEARSGSGSYVRQRPEMQRLTRSWYTTRRGGSPFRAEMGAAGRAGNWEVASETVEMPPAIADRLGADPGAAVMRTRYTFTADGAPVMLSTSWEPLALTGGTPVMFPEEGPHAGRGVVERMAVIGQQIIAAEEVVSARPALAAEAARLGIRAGATVLTIARTYRTGERAVETADIVIPVERYSLVYEVPVQLGPAPGAAAAASRSWRPPLTTAAVTLGVALGVPGPARAPVGYPSAYRLRPNRAEGGSCISKPGRSARHQAHGLRPWSLTGRVRERKFRLGDPQGVADAERCPFIRPRQAGRPPALGRHRRRAVPGAEGAALRGGAGRQGSALINPP